MAWSLAATDNWGLTARMNVDFQRPVRLGVPIRAEGWITGDRRRIVETAAGSSTRRPASVLATATATYVAADAERKARAPGALPLPPRRGAAEPTAERRDRPSPGMSPTATLSPITARANAFVADRRPGRRGPRPRASPTSVDDPDAFARGAPRRPRAPRRSRVPRGPAPDRAGHRRRSTASAGR